MRPQTWRGALGLRGRIVGAVLVTAVATLVVAAVALLGPLEHVLRNAELNTLKKEVTPNSTVSFTQQDLALLLPHYSSPPSRARRVTPVEQAISDQERQMASQARIVHGAVFRIARSLGGRIGASEVALLTYPRRLGPARVIVAWPDQDLAQADLYDDVAKISRARRPAPTYTFGAIDGDNYARAAIPFTTPTADPSSPNLWVLAVRKPLGEVSAAVASVRTAFIYAALAGLALTLLFAIPLADRIVRRLRRLRQAAVRLTVEGPGVDVPADRAHDEVGDLARTFVTMQRRLHQQEEARRAFVATASHELRTPLASLDGILELLEGDLRDGEPDLEDAVTLLERARAQSRRLGRLAADLLDLSRIDAVVELRSEPVELSELSRAVLAEFELGTGERGIATALDDPPGSVWALGDPGSVARILRILLDNAVRMSPDGGEVKVELRGGPHASLSVCDQGPGVAADERALIFERFKRGRETAGQAGFGLGLAIGRELAERMGGELVLDDAHHPGAKFTLRLPATEAPSEEPLPVA
jgi:signal transduction histidine kinase